MTYPAASGLYPATSGVYPSLGASSIAIYTDDTTQYPVLVLRVDWTRTGFASPYATLDTLCEEVTVERSVTGDLPAEAGLVEGYASAQLTTTVGGVFPDGTNAADVLAPYRTDSPLYGLTLIGAPITCDMGLLADTGPVITRQFTGRVRSVRVDSATKTVRITALDGADGLRAPITFPQYGQPRGAVISKGYKFDINTQAVIDYVLRQNGIYASPPPVSTAQLSVTGHGWMVAEIGRSEYPSGVATLITADSWWVPGPFAMLAVQGIWDNQHTITTTCYAKDQFNPVPGAGMGVAMWVRVGNDMIDIIPSQTRPLVELNPVITTSNFSFQLTLTSGGTVGISSINATSVNPGITVSRSVTTPAQWVYVAAHLQIGISTTTVTLRTGGVSTTSTGVTTTALAYLRDQMQVITHTDVRDWSNLQIWYDPNPPTVWPGETWTPQASIGVGYNRLSHLPDVVNADSWQVIRDVTAAEYGLCGFDATGKFSFTSRVSAPDTNTIAKTITADRALLDLALETSSDAVRNVITTQTTAAYLTPDAAVKSQDVTTWETPVGIKKYKVPLPYGTIGPVYIGALFQYTTPSWIDTLLEGFVAVQSTNPGIEIPGGSFGYIIIHFEHVTDAFALAQVPEINPTVSTAIPAGNRVGILTIENRYTAPIRFATTSGSPALRVQGWALVTEPTVTETIQNSNSVTQLGQRIFAIPSSPYRQLIAPLRPVATQLLTQLTNPVPVVDSVSVLGDPSLPVGAVVRMVDSQGQGSFKAAVVRIVRTLNNQGLFDSLTVRPIAPPRLGITDDLELGLADSTLIAGP